jgi:hypothetical protein
MTQPPETPRQPLSVERIAWRTTLIVLVAAALIMLGLWN